MSLKYYIDGYSNDLMYLLINNINRRKKLIIRKEWNTMFSIIWSHISSDDKVSFSIKKLVEKLIKMIPWKMYAMTYIYN